MKIVQINTVCGSGSTGKICVAISELLTDKGIENYIYYTAGSSDYPLGKKYMSSMEAKIQALKSRIFANYGFNSKHATKRLLKELEVIKPDIVHLHNLHGHNVHLGLLFAYLKENKIKVFWTFHDCWAFTGYCPHYEMYGCNQWKENGCKKCPQKKKFSWIFDRSQSIFEKKKSLFAGLDMTIITPSRWLADQVKQSFLREYDVKVINNGIDLSVFYPQESDFRQRYNLEDKFIVLGVAFGWGRRKGLDVFIELAKMLDERYQIVLVGTDDKVDKQLPNNIISIHRTQNQRELAEIYTAADVFVNPTREENFPTTHLESIACGTPVIAFDTGGCSEMLDETCGVVVERDNERALYNAILIFIEEKLDMSADCRNRGSTYDQHRKFLEYVELYI